MDADQDLDISWLKLVHTLSGILGKKLESVDAVLFLIGVQELGKGRKVFSKEEKQDLIHIGICKVLSLSGFYELEGLDEEGWPHWKLVNKVPRLELKEQEKFLKMQVIEYFEKENILNDKKDNHL
jgi:hypothetical protein